MTLTKPSHLDLGEYISTRLPYAKATADYILQTNRGAPAYETGFCSQYEETWFLSENTRHGNEPTATETFGKTLLRDWKVTVFLEHESVLLEHFRDQLPWSGYELDKNANQNAQAIRSLHKSARYVRDAQALFVLVARIKILIYSLKGVVKCRRPD